MNKGITAVLTFVLGAVAGSTATWYFLKTKYERITQEEIDSVKEAYFERYGNKEEEYFEEPKEESYSTDEYREMLNDLGYATNENDGDNINSNNNNTMEGAVESMNDDVPYVITPEEFGENPEYDCETLIYYADGVLADTWNNVIKDIDDLIGEESLNHFGDYEDDPDTVYVRNDLLRTDYEIQLDESKFKED